MTEKDNLAMAIGYSFMAMMSVYKAGITAEEPVVEVEAEKVEKETKKKKAVKKAAPEPDPAQVEEKHITGEQLRAVLATKAQDGKTALIVDLFQHFGAEKLSDLKEEQYDDVYKEAQKL